MSYDIKFKVKVEGIDRYISLGYCGANITWNVGNLIRSCTGLKWVNNENNGLVSEVVEHISLGLRFLINSPEDYRHLESPNGWGTIDGVVRFFTTIIEDWESLQKDMPKVSKVATFWIE